eukprot:12913126-Prorocentrum_lima.AAC.1
MRLVGRTDPISVTKSMSLKVPGRACRRHSCPDAHREPINKCSSCGTIRRLQSMLVVRVNACATDAAPT